MNEIEQLHEDLQEVIDFLQKCKEPELALIVQEALSRLRALENTFQK